MLIIKKKLILFLLLSFISDNKKYFYIQAYKIIVFFLLSIYCFYNFYNFYEAAVAIKISILLICLVLYFRKIILLNICILYCLVALNTILI